jgi:phospholipase C
MLACTSSASADGGAKHGVATPRTPIKHLITIIGENRSFDHVFGL